MTRSTKKWRTHRNVRAQTGTGKPGEDMNLDEELLCQLGFADASDIDVLLLLSSGSEERARGLR